MSLARITRMKSARGFHSPSWPIAFQHSFSHLPASTKWPFGRWASTKTTKPNSKTTRNRGRLSFRSFCKRNTFSTKINSDGACGRTNFNLIRTKIQSQMKSLPKSQNIASWPSLTIRSINIQLRLISITNMYTRSQQSSSHEMQKFNVTVTAHSCGLLLLIIIYRLLGYCLFVMNLVLWT